MHTERNALVDAYHSKIATLDPDLFEASTHASLTRWITEMPEVHLATATTMLEAVLDVDEPSSAATLLSLIDTTFRNSIAELGVTSALVVELAASRLIAPTEACDLVTTLETSDAERRRELTEGLPVPNRDLPRAHECFYAVWKAAPREAQHRDRLHHSEPRPTLNTRGFHELGIFFGEQITPALESAPLSELPTAHRTTFASSLDFARRARDDAPNAGTAPWFLRGPDEDLLNLAYYVKAFADAHVRRGRASVSESSANHAAELVTRLLARADTTRVARFVRKLDEELRRLDVISALGARTVPSSSVAQAVYRAENIWLARLESGVYGLLLKRGRTSTWLEGGLDEMLASVPDAFFEAAVGAAKGPAR
jgi:hypothetical protein